ncbi:Protein of unknown function [Bacillus toyonensis]|nr:Protein of unknown function [Bacillus toyonensis]
MESSRHPGG